MRKRIISSSSENVSSTNQNWLDLEPLVQVEITSEEVEHPIESALTPGRGSGWRAARPGEQIIRLLFDKPQKLRRIHLLFCEDQQERTQEFVLRWSPNHGQSYTEIVRQQYNFSPLAATREVEDYGVDLDGVTALELRILPDVRGGSACGSLAEWFLAGIPCPQCEPSAAIAFRSVRPFKLISKRGELGLGEMASTLHATPSARLG